jgi:hypothetical protein
MSGTRRRKLHATRVGISAEACYHWQRGDKHACHRELGIMPFDFSPFHVEDPEPPQWLVEKERGWDGKGATDLVAGSANWRRAWELRQALIELAGEPGPMDRHGRPLGVVLPPSERWR